VADSAATAALVSSLSLIGVASVVVAGGALARARLDRADQAAWDAEWEVYEPLWSRRRRA
jgi:hypothetical protein